MIKFYTPNLLRLLVAGLLVLATKGYAIGASPNGVFALGTPNTPIEPAVLDNPNVDGLALRYFWANLESSDGEFNWSVIDHDVAQAAAHRKAVSLSVTTGTHTPDWVFAAGAARRSFAPNLAPWARRPCRSVPLPIPWDPIYMSKWLGFVRAFGQRYGSNPTVVRVIVSGINAQTVETSLPHGSPRRCPGMDNITTWQQAGYTRAKLESTWETIADTFARSFPTQQLVLGLVQKGGLPPIDDSGHRILGAAEDIKGMEDLISLGVRRYGRRFVVENAGLSTFWDWERAGDITRRAKLGLQMLWAASGDPRCRMNHFMTPCDPYQVLKESVNRGIRARASFLEIYVPDLLNPALSGIIADAHTRLTARTE